MPKITVDGTVIEYEQDELLEAVEILREDHAIKAFGSQKQQLKEITEWINEQKAGKTGGEPTNSGNGTGGDPGNQPPEPGEPTPIVGEPTPTGPQPPPVVPPEERPEPRPRRKSKWWGDALPSDD